MNVDRINGYGALFRFITPVLVTIVISILGSIKEDVKDLKMHFANHLLEHKQVEIVLERRLSCIETALKMEVHDGTR